MFDRIENGGNGDGKISSSDSIYSRLLLWQDRNHDGVSQPEELITMMNADIDAISLNYKASRRRDRHGNLFRWRSRVYGGAVAPWAWDVILLTRP